MKTKIVIVQLALHLITGSIALGQSSNQITILGESDFYALNETNIDYKETSVQSMQLLGGPSIFFGARIMPTITSFNFNTVNNSTVQTTAKLNYGVGVLYVSSMANVTVTCNLF